jgi:streptogramin lyase
LLSGISSITEFPVPSVSSIATDGITKGPDGNLWFTEGASSAIGMINPTTHAISSFATPTASSNPQGITAGPDGNLWFTEWWGYNIGMINPTTHAISEIKVPKVKGILTHPNAITAGPDGNLWFTEFYGGGIGRIGEINPTSHTISQFTLSQSVGGGFGLGITAGPDGNIWFTCLSLGEIGTINPTTDAMSFYPVINYGGPDGIVAGPDGNMWFTGIASVNGSSEPIVGMFNPTTHAQSLLVTPTGNNGAPPLGDHRGP